MKGSEAMEDALSLLAPTGPEYAGKLANHGPMAAQALVALERPDAVVPWVETYRKRLLAHPGGTRPIDPAGWREALGDNDRVGDWIVLFRRELEERPWKVVLAEWTARLSPGVVAAAFHGAIRTAHGGAQPRSAGDAGARAGARARGSGTGPRRTTRCRNRRARRSRRPDGSPQPRSPPCRSFRRSKQHLLRQHHRPSPAARHVPAFRRSGRRGGRVRGSVRVHERPDGDVRHGVPRERDAGNA